MVIVKITVENVRGKCALGYSKGDSFLVKDYYFVENHDKPLCIHALASMLTILTLMLKGYSAKKLGIGPQDHVAYIQCPDPGKPYTEGGTVIFKLERTG
ncbi:MAG: hypothetical protein B6U89_04535 [Desulfurococcales archaeon ex4484_58]|nr:MAG: hypothetical protein B6U89_04535 [Desulfurococcales archaeon ex4484_58]